MSEAFTSVGIFPRVITTDEKAIEYQDTVWEDMKIVPGAFQFVGVGDPTLVDWQPGGSGTTFKVYKFQLNNAAYFTVQVSHRYKQGTDLEAHLHWTPADRGNEESGNLVGWKIDYSWANVNGVFAPSATVDLSDACTGTDDYHEIASSVAIVGTSKNISSMLVCKVYRSDTGADDTWVGTTAAQSPALLEVDFHFEIDTAGSRQEFVK